MSMAIITVEYRIIKSVPLETLIVKFLFSTILLYQVH